MPSIVVNDKKKFFTQVLVVIIKKYANISNIRLTLGWLNVVQAYD